MKFDPYNHEEKHRKWRGQPACSIPGLTPENADLVIQFLDDMERGLNVGAGSKKGGRSYARLNALRYRMTFLAKQLQARSCAVLTRVSETEIHDLFSDMRRGKITRIDGKMDK